MNKTLLIQDIAKKSGLQKKDVEIFLSAFTDSITDALKSGEKVQLTGFGTFEVRKRAPRTIKSPQNGKNIDIPESYCPVFKAGKSLKDAVNLS